jgi:hypothetical protein
MKPKRKITEKDYIKANRIASRREEIEAHGHPVNYKRVHKSKKIYNRKKIKAGNNDLPFSFYRHINFYFTSIISERADTPFSLKASIAK